MLIYPNWTCPRNIGCIWSTMVDFWGYYCLGVCEEDLSIFWNLGLMCQEILDSLETYENLWALVLLILNCRYWSPKKQRFSHNWRNPKTHGWLAGESIWKVFAGKLVDIRMWYMFCGAHFRNQRWALQISKHCQVEAQLPWSVFWSALTFFC